jgi:hypothetical protein
MGGQGRRCLAALLLCACSLSAIAAELPDAPSSGRVQPVSVVTPAPRDSSILTATDAAEWAMPAVVLPAETKPARKVFDKKFALLTGLGTALTIADYEMTQHCLAARTCVETDPLLPHSRAGMYGTNIPLNAALFYWGYKRKAAGKKLWWLPPLAVVGSHAVGVITNIRVLR